MSDTSVLPHMSKAPRTHHRPRVHKGALGLFWWSACTCGHATTYSTWRRALIDALIHSDELI